MRQQTTSKTVRKTLAFLFMSSGLALSQTVTADNNETAQLTCPSSPNCVSSLATGDHYIAPLDFTGQSTSIIREKLLQWLEDKPRVTVTKSSATIITAEFKSSLFGFVDDVTLMIQPDGLVDVRSASRTGYSDFGVNRGRMEKLRVAVSTQ